MPVDHGCQFFRRPAAGAFARLRTDLVADLVGVIRRQMTDQFFDVVDGAGIAGLSQCLNAGDRRTAHSAS
jgi:hypothetical protein